MDDLNKIFIDDGQVGVVVNSMLNKLLPKQIGSSSYGQDAPISEVAEFIKLAGIQYVPNEEIKEWYFQRIGDLAGLVLKNSKGKRSGETQSIDYMFDLCNLGVVFHHLGISYEVGKELVPVFDFEFYHNDFERQFGYRSDIPILDLVYFCNLNGLSEGLKNKLEDNPLDEHCKEKPTRKATKQDIEKEFAEHDSFKKLALLWLEKPPSGNESMCWLSLDGEIVYVGAPPSPPRKLHTFEEIKNFMGRELEIALEGYCNDSKFDNAYKILYRRNKVKDFFDSDIVIPQGLVKNQQEFFHKLDLERVKGRIENLVGEYTPRSLSYGLDTPKNFTKQEYTLLRSIQLYVGLLRRSYLLYDTAEKRELAKNIHFQEPISKIAEFVYKVATSQDRFKK